MNPSEEFQSLKFQKILGEQNGIRSICNDQSKETSVSENSELSVPGAEDEDETLGEFLVQRKRQNQKRSSKKQNGPFRLTIIECWLYKYLLYLKIDWYDDFF